MTSGVTGYHCHAVWRSPWTLNMRQSRVGCCSDDCGCGPHFPSVIEGNSHFNYRLEKDKAVISFLTLFTSPLKSTCGPQPLRTITKTRPWKTWPPDIRRLCLLPAISFGSSKEAAALGRHAAHQQPWRVSLFSKHNLSSCFPSLFFMVCIPEKEKATVPLLSTCVFRGFLPLAVSNLCYISLLFSFLLHILEIFQTKDSPTPLPPPLPH